MKASRLDVLSYRVAAQSGAAILDQGVQDTGPDGARWALTIRNARPPDLALAWTLRGAPHYYRRSDLAAVAAATAPFSEADAAKRVFDAARPLKAAGIPVLDALARIAEAMRSIVAEPTGKGEVSTELARRLPEPYLRWCRVCQATHLFEQPFRLSALQAGLELQPGTSPPVLQRIPEWPGPAASYRGGLDVVRAYLRLFGPATPAQVAAFLDATQKDVRARWPEDVVEVEVEGERRTALRGFGPRDVDTRRVRLLGPFDPLLQSRDRELVVPDAGRRKQLWVVLGRPGAVLRGAEVVGTWRPRARGKNLQLAVDLWQKVPAPLVEEQGEQLARFRGVRFAGLTDP